MATSRLFEQIVQQNRSVVAEEFFERTSPLVFEKEDSKSRIEVRCLAASDVSQYHKVGTQGQTSNSTTQNTSLDPPTDTSLPNAIDVIDEPPHREAPQRLQWLQVIDVDLRKLRPFIQACRGRFHGFHADHCRLPIQTSEYFALSLQSVLGQFLTTNSYLLQRNSYSRLKITKPMFQILVEECAIFAKFGEYVIDFRWRIKDYEISPPPIRFMLYRNTGYECSYGVRYVEFTNRVNKPPWSLRQFCVYHKYIPGSDKAVSMMIGKEDQPRCFITVNLEDYQRLNDIEDRIADVNLSLDSTLDTLKAFMEMHISHIANNEEEEERDVSAAPKFAKVDNLLFVLKEKQREVAALISSLLERQSGYNIDLQMKALHNLEREACDENAITRQLAEKSSRDSTSVRILTIITLIYLPCHRRLGEYSTIAYPVISSSLSQSFYSTQFVDQTEHPGGGHSLEYTENAWLFFAVTIPLTLFTIVVWYTWSNFRTMSELFASTKTMGPLSFPERVKMMSLLSKRRELPR
ncbi:hypothetical protein CC86DRAFT_400258 [Ophiobolus disseminans]|uniref:Cora-domain-containing protein n=1 Tax=Ophiobolus disseminans TaxID=1469910 RepID=A0A6A7AK19_9PLEO|nr:hypothetical protein CC86DRAFT_400258 [Ophiobolus disseminans]